MKVLGRIIFFAVFILSCSNANLDNILPESFLPSDAEVHLKIANPFDFKTSNDKENLILSFYPEHFDLIFNAIDYLQPSNPIYLALGQDDKNLPSYIMAYEVSVSTIEKDSIAPKAKNTFNIDSLITKTSKLYFRNNGKHIVASNSKEQLFVAVAASSLGDSNSALLGKTSEESGILVHFIEHESRFSELMFTPRFGNSTNTVLLNFEFSPYNLSYNGVIKLKDSINTLIESFRDTKPQAVKVTEIAPDNVNHIISLTFDDFKIFNQNRMKLVNSDTLSTQPTEFLNYVTEIAKVDDALILYSLDFELLKGSIEDKTFLEEFRNVPIFTLNNTSLFNEKFYPFFNFESISYCAFYEESAIFSPNENFLKQLLTKAINNNTLQTLEAYTNLEPKLSSTASFYAFKNAQSISETLDLDLSNHHANVVQLINEDEFAHVNGIIQKFKRKSKKGTVTESLKIDLNSAAINAPQLVQNYYTKGHNLAIQDVNNQLYLFDNSGKLLWKRQLQNEILGHIQQIDMYKNGRLQVAFSTKNKLYVLDRYGKDVGAFPINFEDDITQPLSVFDYDKNRNYRLLITQGDNLLMYDTKQKRVTGFDYNLKKGIITSQPKHFRISSKDYIAFKTENNLVILNRRGKIRVPVNETVNFSDNELYLYRNKFTTSTQLGELIQANSQGNLSRQQLNLPERHSLVSTSKTLVAMSDNVLKIKSKSVSLDYGTYTAPQIFYLNDKIYITTTDKEAKKVYLYDSQAQPIPNFPVYGTSAAVLENIDSDSQLELVTMDGARKLLVYEIN